MAIPPKGEAVFATSAATFFQVGGDPATHTSGAPFLARTIFDSLVYVDLNSNIKPGLAKSWKIAPDWKYIDFFLRDDVTFHNGDKFTAEDVKFSMETPVVKGYHQVGNRKSLSYSISYEGPRSRVAGPPLVVRWHDAQKIPGKRRR
jgi:ABC-type transport system substrate-binding protein